MADVAYVPMERRFCDVNKEPSSGLSRRMLGGKTGTTWTDLVPVVSSSSNPRSAVVVLAPSGVGKTSELIACASRLRDAGVFTFSMRAVDVAVSGVTGAVSDPAGLQAWKDTTDRAVFFVDAIDEARIEGHDLDHVLQRFARDVDPATKSIQLVLSSRNDVWSADDIRHVVRVLALPSETPPVRVVRLEPLSPDDLALYAKAKGVLDADAFMQAFRDEELDDLFDLRPPDARILVDYWKQHGAFGSWSEMLEASIEASVRNENRHHTLQQQFTLEEARRGLARIGAATVLGKRPVISLPGTSHPGEVNAERLFADRLPSSTSQLLAMGLFAPKGLHSVQLPQGAPSHFLAASWLGERARRGMDARALEDALFVAPFGAGHTFTPASRSPVVGWVAGTVPALRKRLLKELPHVLLFEGDPSKLSRGECIEALRAVLANIKLERNDPSPTAGTLRQIAKHQIADPVARLLIEFSGTPRAERLLLRIAEEGRYVSIAAPALAIALSPTGEVGVGDVAIRVVAAVGTTEERTRLLALLHHQNEWIRLALVLALTPEVLNGAALVQLVTTTTAQNVAYMLGHALTRASLNDIDAILIALMPSLTSSIATDSTEAHVEVASMLAVVRLSRGGPHVPTWIPDLLLAIESHLAGPFYIPGDTVDALAASLVERADLRRAVWEVRSTGAEGTERGIRMMSPKLGPAQSEDLEWFWAKRENTADPSLKRELGWPLAEAFRRTSLPERARYMERQDVPAELKAYIQVVESQDAHAAAMHLQFEAKQAADKAALRAKNIADIQPRRAEIEAGSHVNALVWGWQHLSGTDNRRGRLGTGRLVEAVGRDLADVFIAGFQRWWRRHEPSMTEPGSNSVSLANLAGLTGLSLEVERGLDFATLTDAEVERATRYALYELNGFPLWFDALRRTHPFLVNAVLQQVVRMEWDASVEHLGVIHRAPYEPLGTAEMVRELVITELERSPPGHVRTVHYVVGALLLPTKPARDVANTLGRSVAAAATGDVEVLAEWLRGWSHFAPENAAKWLGALAKADQSRFLQVVEPVAALLEDDFGRRGLPTRTKDWAAAGLEAWVRMLHVAVRPEDDIDRTGTGVYSPGQRDRAQEFRNRCVSLLAKNPSREAFEALRRIRASKEMKSYADMVDRLILSQLTEATEHLASAWTEDDILRVEQGDERPPRTNADLLALVMRHLVRVAELLENDDFSYATLFDENEDETEVQRWVASSLKLVNRGLYSVEREPEVQDNKLMDISITVPGVGRVPIEIKPLYLKRPSYRELQDFISDQLLGRYMRPAAVDCGIFLLVPLKVRTWRVGTQVLSIDQLRVKLQAHANKAGAKAYKEVHVMCINVAASRPIKGAATSASRGPAASVRSAGQQNALRKKRARPKGQ